MALHTLVEILEWLHADGDVAHRAYGSYASTPFRDGDSDQLILLAGGPAWRPPESAGTIADNALNDVRSDGPGAWV